MSKVVAEEFDVCHNFVESWIQFILPIEQRKFMLIEHNISCEDFEISICYDKSHFEHKINEFVRDIIKEAQKSDLCGHGWAVHCPLVEEVENPPHEYFLHSVIITFTGN